MWEWLLSFCQGLLRLHSEVNRANIFTSTASVYRLPGIFLAEDLGRSSLSPQEAHTFLKDG